MNSSRKALFSGPFFLGLSVLLCGCGLGDSRFSAVSPDGIHTGYNDGSSGPGSVPTVTPPVGTPTPSPTATPIVGPLVIPTPHPIPSPTGNSYWVDGSRPQNGNGTQSNPFNRINHGLGILTAGDVLYVKGGTYTESLNINGADGNLQNRIFVRAAAGEQVVLQNSGEILDVRSDYWVFDGLEFDQQNGSSDAIQVHGGDGTTFVNCEIHSGQRYGIQIFDGDDILISQCDIHDFSTDGDAHCIATDPTNSGEVIRNFYLEHSNIWDCSGDGIQFYAQDGTNPSDYVDGGGIVGNQFFKSSGFTGENAIDSKGANGILIQGNQISGFDTNKAIVVQKGCSNFTVIGNTIFDSNRGIEFRGEDGWHQSGHLLAYNLFFDIANYYVIKLDDVANARVHSNTIVDSPQADSILIENGQGTVSGEFHNNLSFNSGTPNVTGGGHSLTYSHNGWFGTSSGGDLNHATDTTGADPLFVDRSSNNYSLQAGSPAIDQGTQTTSPVQFNGAAPDLGAFER